MHLQDRRRHLGLAELTSPHKEQVQRILGNPSGFLRLLIGQLPGVLWSTDNNLCFTSLMGAGLEALDLRPNQLLGVPLSDYLGNSDPEFAPLAAHFKALEGQYANFSWKWKGRIFQAAVEPLRNSDGSVLGVIGVAFDCTEKEMVARELHESWQVNYLILNSVSAHIAVLDQDGTILAVNQAWERFARENEGRSDRCGVGANYLETCQRSELGGCEHAPMALQGIQAVLRGEQSSFTMEYPCHSPVKQRWFLLQATSAAELRQAAVVMHVDVTERKEAEFRKDEFLAMLAHELRNPLAPLRNALHILKQPVTKEVAVEKVRDLMERQVQHLTRMVDDLLDVSRLTRGHIELRKTHVDMKEVITQTLETMRPIFNGRRHQVQVLLPDDPLWVEGDPMRLEQIITNLLDNAARYTDPGGTIEIRARPENDTIVIEVQDTGVGIPPNMLPHIFDVFVQAERRLHEAKGGVGIGLTLVRKLVELHGGRVEASSPGPGQGSLFVVHFPANVPRGLNDIGSGT